MENTLQGAVDQKVCQIVLERQLRRSGPELAAGDAIRDMYVATGLETLSGSQTHVAEAIVEQRHLDAVRLFRDNHWTDSVAGGNFRIEPKGAENVR
jgi:hypothetical protein